MSHFVKMVDKCSRLLQIAFSLRIYLTSHALCLYVLAAFWHVLTLAILLT